MARRHRVWQGGEEEAFSDGIQQNSIEFTTFNWSSLICVRSLRYNLSAVGVKIHCVRIQEEKISVESFEVLNTFRVSNGQDLTHMKREQNSDICFQILGLRVQMYD